MKKVHIVGLIVIAVVIGIIVSLAADYSHYSNFAEAKEKKSEVQVIGHLVKSKQIDYDPKKDANHFSFYMTDDKGEECRVTYAGEKPEDFERSESIVLTGKMNGNEFFASNILMKCPSKYKNNQLASSENK